METWCVFFDESKVGFKQGISYDRTVHNFTIIHVEIDDIRLVHYRVFPEVGKAKLFGKFHENSMIDCFKSITERSLNGFRVIP